MSDRIIQGLPTAPRLITDSDETQGRVRPKRTLAALVTGASIALSGFLVVGLSGPGAASDTNVFAAIFHALNPAPAPYVVHADAYAAPGDGQGALDLLVKHKHKKLSVKASARPRDKSKDASGEIVAAGLQPRRSVCVRTCDGFFFPVGPVGDSSSLASHEADCAGLCPDAQTALFIEPAGSDKIEDAVSIKGARYTALPAAFRHRETSDNSCTCHRNVGANYSLLRDFTLRKGDSVMTANGFRVFQGASRLPYVVSNFTTLAKASMPRMQRSVLMAMERVALPTLKHSRDMLLVTPKKLTTAAYTPTPEDNAIRFVEPFNSVTD